MAKLRCILLPFLLAIFASSLGRGQELGPELGLSAAVDLNLAGNAAQTNLELARRFIADEQWEGAVEKIRSVMEDNGDELIAWQSDESDRYARYVSVRTWCHFQLAQWHREAPRALAQYRQRVDPLAGRWYQEVVAATEGRAKDAEMLERIVRQMFLSGFGDDASYRLGEIALERGDFRRARECWEQLSPVLRCSTGAAEILQVAPGTPWWLALRQTDWQQRWESLEPHCRPENVAVEAYLAYPDTELPLAEIRARLILVSILEGSPERAELELEMFRRLHPEATGRMAGEQGRLAEILSQFLTESQLWPQPPSSEDWATFAGNLTRNHIAGSTSDPAARALWSRPVTRINVVDEQLGGGRLRVAESAKGALSYYPLVSDKRVVLIDPEQIRVFDLQTGHPAFDASNRAADDEGDDADTSAGSVFRLAARGLQWLPLSEPYFGVPRFTGTIRGEHLFAKVGSPWTGAREPDQLPTDHRGVLVGLDLAAEGKMLRGFPISPESEKWAFEGAPVTDGRRLYVAMRYRDTVGVAAHVACFDLETGEMLWRTFVCAADTLAEDTATEITQHLLTLDQNRIYFNSHLGAVAALSTETGEVSWAVRYPRTTHSTSDPYRNDRHFFRDLVPALLHKGLVICAPADSDSIFALSAITGSVVWATLPEQASDAIHLLGVGEGTLLASGDSLYWIDVLTGAVRCQFPDGPIPSPGEGIRQPRAYGRGILAGDLVYWPTREKLFVFFQRPAQRSGSPQPRMARAPINLASIQVEGRPLEGGNLVIADGVLLIAGSDRIVALNDYGQPIPSRKAPGSTRIDPARPPTNSESPTSDAAAAP